jgi:hypothetical protein
VQVKLFRLTTSATKGGVPMTEEEATEQYHRSQTAERGGWASATGLVSDDPLRNKRSGIGATTVTHQDNENHLVLTFLRDLLKCAPSRRGPDRIAYDC